MKRFLSVSSILGVLVFLGLMLTPLSSEASAPPMSQVEYIKWLVEMAGDSGDFDENSTWQDYEQWAVDNNILPHTGFDPNDPVDQEYLVKTLTDMLLQEADPDQENPDYLGFLISHGLLLPHQSVITRSGFVYLADTFWLEVIPEFGIEPSPSKPGQQPGIGGLPTWAQSPDKRP